MADSSLTVGFRVRGVQMFVRGTNTDGDRQIDSDTGIITYGDDGRYQVTSMRLGFRSDHVADLLRPEDEHLNINDPMGRDAELLLDEDSSGIMHIRRDGKTITKLSKQDRVDEKKQHQAELAKLRAEADKAAQELADLRAEREADRKVEATV